MASWTLTLKQKKKYGWDNVQLTSGNMMALVQIVDAIKASDVDQHKMRFSIESDVEVEEYDVD